MATSSFTFALSLRLNLNPHSFVSHTKPCCSFKCQSFHLMIMKNPISRVRHVPPVYSSSIDLGSPDDLPQEIAEDGKFVPLESSDAGLGPPALLLAGFNQDEISKIQLMLDEAGGDFLRIVLCTEEMKKGTLMGAFETFQTDLDRVQIIKDTPKICFISGLSGEEIMILIDAFHEAGFDSTIFAALMPNNANKPIFELFEEIKGDHEQLTKSNSG